MTDDTCTDHDPRIEVPETVRRDERFEPRVAGLAAGERVRLTVKTDDDEPWSSTATFEANAEGIADLGETPPCAGDYETTDPMGPIRSLTPVGTDDPDRRYRMSAVGSHELQFRAEAASGRATATVTVRHADPGVTARDPGDGVHGTWYEPPGEGPHPPVVALHGSGGHVKNGAGALLASQGFATLALRYLGVGDLPERPKSVPLEYVDDAVEWFLDRDAVDAGNGYGLYGVSMGAQLAFVLATRDDRVAAVVSDSGNHICYESGDGGAWADDGMDLPRIGIPDAPPDTWDRPVDEPAGDGRGDGDQPVAVDRSGMWLGMLDAESTATRRTATLPVEESGAAFCLLSAGADAQWPSATFHHMLVARLDALDYEPTVEHHWYQDAGHGIGEPYVPTSWRPAAGDGIASGGDPAAHAAAQADAWPRVRTFLGSELDG